MPATTAPLNAAALSAAAKASKSIYPPARVLALDVPGALSRRYPAVLAAADGGNISGRHLHMTPAGYAASVGRMTADSVADAIVYAVVHHLNGSRTLADLADAPDAKKKATLPAWVGAGIRATFGGVKPTNGCSPDQLHEWSALLWAKIAGAKKPEAAAPAPERAKPAPVLVTKPAPVARAFAKSADHAALLSGALTREAEAGELSGEFLSSATEEIMRLFRLEQFRAMASEAQGAPKVAPAIVPTVGNDLPADARAFVAQVGEAKARAFLDALAAALAPALPVMPAAPVRVKRAKKAA